MEKLTKLSKNIKSNLYRIEKRFSKISYISKISKHFKNSRFIKEISNEYQSPSKLRKYNKENRMNEAYDNSIRNNVYNKLNKYKMPLEDEDYRKGDEIITFDFSSIKKEKRKNKDENNQITKFTKAEKDIFYIIILLYRKHIEIYFINK